ncbi:hypothetical protein ABHC71_09080 [Ruminococcus bicirculans (ex Wegman et al. 2014)]
MIIAVIISFVGRDMFSDWKNHIIYSSDDISVIARVNRTMFGNRCDICICRNGAVMKKVDEPLALQSDYDPIEKHYYEVLEDEQELTIRVKCSEDSSRYEEVTIEI